MPTYKIEITETLQRQIEVEASSKEEALKKIKEQYQNQESHQPWMTKSYLQYQ